MIKLFKFIISDNKSFAVRKLFIIFLWVPYASNGQLEIARAGSFRYYNIHDVHSTFLESEDHLPCKTDSIYSITIVVKNVRNNRGVIRFKFFDDENPFPHDTGFLRIVVHKSQMINNTYVATYRGFKQSYMGIALHDDENSNKRLDFDWFTPSEGYAFSDYYHTTFRRPDFENFRFLLKEDRVVVMEMRYH